MSRLDYLGRGIPLRRQLTVGTVPNGGPGVLQQPGERDPMLGRQVQNRSRRDGGQARAAVKIAEGGKGRKEWIYRAFGLSSPACRNSDVRFQAGWLGAFATDTAVRTMTRSC
jgi:hypothetical protein